MRKKTYDMVLSLGLFGIALVGGLGVLQGIQGAGIDFPFGPDPDIWGKAALLAKYNAPQTVPPSYPELSSLLSFSDGLVQGALRANVLGMMLGVLGAGFGAAWLCKPRVLSLVVGLATAAFVVFCLPFFPFMFFMQPDLLAFGLIACCCASLIGVWRFQSRLSIVCCGLAFGLAFSTREHGLVLLVAAVALIPFLFVRHRFRNMFLFLLGVQFGGGLGAGAPHMPFFHPHGGLNGSLTKALVAVRDTVDQKTESNTTPSKWEVLAQKTDSRSDYFWYLMMQSKEKSADFHSNLLLMGGGFLILGFFYGRRIHIVAIISIAPLFATLVFWSQWRHFFVMSAPMVIFGVGALGVLFSRISTRLGAVFILAYVGYSCSILYPAQQYYARFTLGNLQKEQAKKSSFISLSQKIRKRADAQSLIMAQPIFSILTGLNPILLQGKELMDPKPPSHPNFVYWTYVVSSKPMSRQWELLEQQGNLYLYQRKRPSDVPLSCLKGYWDGPIVERLPSNGVRLKPNALEGCP